MPRHSLSLAGDSPEIPLYRGDIEKDITTVTRHRLAEHIAPLSYPTKLPCPAWGIPAEVCPTGSQLAQIQGTVCSRCYALTNRYRFANVQDKLWQRYQGLYHELWVPSITFMVRYFCDNYFRLFDSGDIQNETMMQNICMMARYVPDVQIWMPTREITIIEACAALIPDNLIIRYSVPRIDQQPPDTEWLTSTVCDLSPTPASHICPAPNQGNRCDGEEGDKCRACWDKDTKNVGYWLH